LASGGDKSSNKFLAVSARNFEGIENARRDEPGGHPFLPRKVGNLTKRKRGRPSLTPQVAEICVSGDIAPVLGEVALSIGWTGSPVYM
jgi:hypothetical protein